MIELASPTIPQALFGNPTGTYDCPDFVEALIASLFDEIERVYWNKNQKEWDKETDPKFSGLTVRPYSWGECDCEWDNFLFDEPHTPTCYQTLVDDELVKAHKFKRDKEGIVGSSKKYAIEIKDGVRRKYCKQLGLTYPEGCAVHCTCDWEKRYDKWFLKNRKGKNGHADNCEIEIPNFTFDGVELRWYKYFGRGMSLNCHKTEKQWREWYDKCLKQIRKEDVKM